MKSIQVFPKEGRKKGRGEEHANKYKTMIDFNLIILIIILNKNGQHITTKKQRLCDRIRSKISLCANCKKIHFKYKDTNT